MVFHAAQKLRAGGLSAASMRQVAEAADAPRGSLQHYFPEGKDQLIEEALAWAGDFAAGYVRDYLDGTTTPTPSGILSATARYWIDELRRCDFELGCPMVGAITAGARTRRSDAAARATLRAWSAPIVDGLTRAGIAPARTPALANTILAAIEGAIALARIERSPRPLQDVVAVLGPALDAHVVTTSKPAHPEGAR